MKLALIIVAGIILFGISQTESKEDIIIPKESLRLRIIPNSNSSEDLEVKFLLQRVLGNKLEQSLSDAQTLEESKQIIEKNLEKIENKTSEILTPLNKRHEINFGKNYFPSKSFKGVVYPSGMYDSLIITIGEGKGDNWWCVLFPPLCSLKRENDLDEVNYQFFVSRIINKFR